MYTSLETCIRNACWTYVRTTSALSGHTNYYYFQKYTNLSFLEPLVYEMTKMTPRTRPTAKESLSIFRYIVRHQRQVSLRWMLLEPDITESERVRRCVRSLVREIRRFAKKLIGG